MEKKYLVNLKEMEVLDGKVIISSDELANAIVEHEFDLLSEEEAEAFIMNCINGACSN